MIELERVSKSYGSLNILDRFSHVFENGSKTAVTGASGIGKTTLLNLISGLLPIDEGLIKIDGQITDTPSNRTHPSRRNLGFAFQIPALWPHMTVKDNILYGLAGIDRQEQDNRLDSIAESFEIIDILKKFPGEISGGQAKRVSLARTMVVNPKHLLLDEPLSNLDVELKDKVLQVIKQYGTRHNSTIILITHNPAEIDGLCDRLFSLRSNGLIAP